MQSITFNEAIGQAVAEEMRRDPAVMMFGEGVATKRRELVKEFGDRRVRNTPLAEGIIAGAAVGAAAMGMRPNWACYIHASDVDETTHAIRKAGGKVYREPADIPGVGRFSVVTDPPTESRATSTPMR